MKLVPVCVEFNEDLVPSPSFAPESEEMKEIYYKLAAIAKTKVFWSSLALLVISCTFAALVWTSGSTIYHCFTKSNSEPPVYTEISLHICIILNNESVTSYWSIINSGGFAFLSFFNFLMVFLFYSSTALTVETSVKLLVYGVKTNCSFFYNVAYSIIAINVGLVFYTTLHQSLTPLGGATFEYQYLYFWGYANYPQTFIGNSLQLLKNLGILGGLVKFMLLSVKDPFDLFCSLSNMMKVSSNDHKFQLPDLKFTAQIEMILLSTSDREEEMMKKKKEAKKEEERRKKEEKKKTKEKKTKEKIEEDKKKKKEEEETKKKQKQEEEDCRFQKILTTLDKQGLLLPYDGEATKSGIIDSFKGFLGLRSEGCEKEVRSLINDKGGSGYLSSDERIQMEQMLKKLLLNMWTKKWPLVLLFSMFYTSTVIISEYAYLKGGKSDWSWELDPPMFLFWCHIFWTICAMSLLQYFYGIIVWVLSLTGACFEAYFTTCAMITIINSSENYYIVTPYITIAMAFIQVLGILKMVLLARVIQRGKSLLLKSPNEKFQLSLALSESISTNAF